MNPTGTPEHNDEGKTPGMSPLAPRRSAAARVRTIRPRWLGLFLGQLILRICSSGRRKECRNESCQLRVLCKCAMDDFRAATVVERRVWTIVAVCGGAVLLYWLLGI